MRCPHCELPNEEGNALCYACGMPLTVYGRQVTGEVSEATRVRAAKLAVRPVAVNLMAVYCVLAALGGPFWKIAGMFARRTQVNTEGTNYLGAAFGAVGITFAAIVLVPIGIAFLVVAWGILTQRTWAWTAALLLVAVCLIAAWTGTFFAPGLVKFLFLAGGVAVAALWIQRATRDWFGA